MLPRIQIPAYTTEQWLLFALLGLLPILPNLAAIWHCFHRDFESVTEKKIWFGLAVFIPVLGGLAYWIFGRKRGRKP